MQFSVADELEQQNDVMIRWIVKATHNERFMAHPPIHKEFGALGVDFYHLEAGKIRWGWEVFDTFTPPLEFDAVQVVQPKRVAYCIAM